MNAIHPKPDSRTPLERVAGHLAAFAATAADHDAN